MSISSSTALCSLVVSLSLCSWSASACGLPARTVAAYLFLPLLSSLLLSALLSVSQQLCTSLYISVVSRLALRLAAGFPVPLCTSMYLSVLSGSLLHLFPLQSSPLRAPATALQSLMGPLFPYLGVYKVFDFKG